MIDKYGISTALSAAEDTLLKSIASGQRVVEAGALCGHSTLLLSHSATNVVSIDKHEGYGPSTFNTFMSNIRRHGRGNVSVLVGDATELLPHVYAHVAFIDLTGEYDLTKRALASLPGWVEWVAIHDVGRVHCEGVMKAIRESVWELVDIADTLGILRRARSLR